MDLLPNITNSGSGATSTVASSSTLSLCFSNTPELLARVELNGGGGSGFNQTPNSSCNPNINSNHDADEPTLTPGKLFF